MLDAPVSDYITLQESYYSVYVLTILNTLISQISQINIQKQKLSWYLMLKAIDILFLELFKHTSLSICIRVFYKLKTGDSFKDTFFFRFI